MNVSSTSYLLNKVLQAKEKEQARLTHKRQLYFFSKIINPYYQRRDRTFDRDCHCTVRIWQVDGFLGGALLDFLASKFMCQHVCE